MGQIAAQQRDDLPADLLQQVGPTHAHAAADQHLPGRGAEQDGGDQMGDVAGDIVPSRVDWIDLMARHAEAPGERRPGHQALYAVAMKGATARKAIARSARDADMADFRMHGAVHRSEEHTSELQSLMRNSYAVFCLKK